MSNDSKPLNSTPEAVGVPLENPKFYGQRCTAYLNSGEYVKALEDARTLVRILPDAPIGYLKAARCYRLTKRWKAAQTMLDMAAERGGAQTIKAVRSETRKLEHEMKQPKTPFIERLPQELFIEAISYLSPSDLIHSTHVSQRWRSVLTGRPQLWQKLLLSVSEKTGMTSKGIPTQLMAYVKRLQGSSLRVLRLRSLNSDHSGATDVNRKHTSTFDKVLSFLRSHQANVASLTALAMVDFRLESLELEYLQLLGGNLRHLKCSPMTGSNVRNIHIPRGLLPHLQSLETLEYLNNSSMSYDWPLVELVSKSPNMCAMENFAAMRFPSFQYLSLRESTSFINDTVPSEPTYGMYSELRRLQIRGTHHLLPTTFCTSYPLIHLTHLTLQQVTFQIPSKQNSLPSLEELHILENCSSATVRSIINDIHAPRLRSFSLCTALKGGGDQLWLEFCKRVPCLQELTLTRVEVPKLAESLQYLPGLVSLKVPQVHLAASFLDSVAQCVPKLTKLDVSHSTPIASGPLLRLIHSKNGEIDELGIEGCRDLQKEAVDWIKANVRTVKWTGWGDKSEPRGWNIQSRR